MLCSVTLGTTALPDSTFCQFESAGCCAGCPLDLESVHGKQRGAVNGSGVLTAAGEAGRLVAGEANEPQVRSPHGRVVSVPPAC